MSAGRRVLRRTALVNMPVALLAVAFAALLSACCSLPHVGGGTEYTGRFALLVSSGDRHDASSGRFSLTVRTSDLILDLTTPLGTTVARVQSGPEGARVTVPGATGLRTVQGPDADALSEQVLGWALPVSGIADWIQGRPAGGRPYLMQAEADGGTHLEQDGWTIRFDPRGPDGRIHRLQMTRPEQAGAPAVSLRVALDAGGP